MINDLYELFHRATVVAFCAEQVVASVEVVHGQRSAVGTVCVIAVDVDVALARLGRDFDVALRNHRAERELVFLVRPNIHALVDEFITLVHHDQRVTARLDVAIFDRALAEEFAAEVDFAVRRFGNDHEEEVLLP